MEIRYLNSTLVRYFPKGHTCTHMLVHININNSIHMQTFIITEEQWIVSSEGKSWEREAFNCRVEHIKIGPNL